MKASKLLKAFPAAFYVMAVLFAIRAGVGMASIDSLICVCSGFLISVSNALTD